MLEIYPDGFLPFISPEVTDYSAAYGVRWKLGDWDMDSSLVYGKNKMEFTIENTLNRSLGVDEPDGVRCGRLRLRPAGAELVRRAQRRR